MSRVWGFTWFYGLQGLGVRGLAFRVLGFGFLVGLGCSLRVFMML